MAETDILVDASPEVVFDVLADPERYQEWVVGTSETRTIDASWPDVGSKLRWESGVGPLKTGDYTEVLEVERPERLLLQARVRPLGDVRIEVVLERLENGTRVVIREEPVAGALDALHNPVTDAGITARNVLSLQRLKDLVERR